MVSEMKDEEIITLGACALLAGRPELTPEEAIQTASALVQMVQRYCAESRKTTRLKIDFEVETGCHTRPKV
jgi:hypothetical protein